MGELAKAVAASLLVTAVHAAVRTYDFTVAAGTYNPDGQQKQGLLVNGQFPGPTLSATVGDTVQVTVRNKLTEGTLIHWHGLNQNGTPWYDGTPVTQTCPIAPNDSFTYTFIADKVGTSWYHSHYSAQHADGVKGPMVITGGTPSAPYDVDVGPVFLSDNYHKTYQENVRIANGPVNVPIVADSTLINGKGQYQCDLGTTCLPGTPYSTFKFTSGKVHRLRITNADADGTQCFRIDGHNLTVIAVDFTPVTPYTVPGISLTTGQRMDVLVNGTGSPDSSWWMRADFSFITVTAVPQQPSNLKTKAVIYYESANTATFPTSADNAAGLAQCGHEALAELHPVSPQAAFAPVTTKTITVDQQFNSSGYQDFYMNNRTFHGNYNYPILLLAKTGNTSYPDPKWNVYNFGSNATVRAIWINKTPIVHPIHLHGHDFQVLAQGVGAWDGTITNPSNPGRRDVADLPAQANNQDGYLVMQWVANNPGAWGFHCHIAWHASTGLYISLLEQPAKIVSLPISRTDAANLLTRCYNWWSYTNHTVVDQIDSGL